MLGAPSKQSWKESSSWPWRGSKKQQSLKERTWWSWRLWLRWRHYLANKLPKTSLLILRPLLWYWATARKDSWLLFVAPGFFAIIAIQVMQNKKQPCLHCSTPLYLSESNTKFECRKCLYFIFTFSRPSHLRFKVNNGAWNGWGGDWSRNTLWLFEVTCIQADIED